MTDETDKAALAEQLTGSAWLKSETTSYSLAVILQTFPEYIQFTATWQTGGSG